VMSGSSIFGCFLRPVDAMQQIMRAQGIGRKPVYILQIACFAWRKSRAEHFCRCPVYFPPFTFPVPRSQDKIGVCKSSFRIVALDDSGQS